MPIRPWNEPLLFEVTSENPGSWPTDPILYIGELPPEPSDGSLFYDVYPSKVYLRLNGRWVDDTKQHQIAHPVFRGQTVTDPDRIKYSTLVFSDGGVP